MGAGAEAVCAQVRCPVLVISGSMDVCQDPRRGPRLAELTGGRSVVIEGGGHLVQAAIRSR
ncbi:alpha/beta fold hydrolase [Micropruina glycogenica]|uniref:alpha/beta fold hydrolase n=1 Tax=Micropruina glycogenica TaxID=75385 RepID=UPI000CF64376|nr:alpha/beta hydrolase [Micropruina glycogenica]